MRCTLLVFTIPFAFTVPFASVRPLLFHDGINATSQHGGAVSMAHLRNGALLEGNGICTYYNYGGIGAVGTPLAKGVTVAICAMGKGDDWKSHCGATIEFSNDKGSATCEVRDECPECEQLEGHLDTAAFLLHCAEEIRKSVRRSHVRRWQLEVEQRFAQNARTITPQPGSKCCGVGTASGLTGSASLGRA
jgi:hypothetical protein